MEKNNFPQPARVMVISAHPDDPEFSAGGTVAGWVIAGTQATYVVVTDGSKGSADPEMTSDNLINIRQKEQRAAAKKIGISEVVFLGYRDGEIYNTPNMRRDITKQIRLHRPDIVITHDPTARIFQNINLNHPDHRAVGDIVLDCIYPIARDRLNYPEHEQEGLEPHKVLDVFLSGTEKPNLWVDITATMDIKIAALREHKSQFEDMEELEKGVREFARMRAQKVSFEYAEIFRRVQLPG
ncbi:MAG: PIG-L family deacetylase [Chloroflexi bacterium]|nr:PIG-L family deacetylase [Chloroflexota bacterium]